MRAVPFSGRLDVSVACLLVVARRAGAASPSVTRDEIASNVLSLVRFLEVPAGCLTGVDAFDDEISRALRRLINVGWIQGRTVHGVARFEPRDVADSAIAWIRTRCAPDAQRLFAFERLDRAVTDLVRVDTGEVPAAGRAEPGR